jgi:hypothetical protein
VPHVGDDLRGEVVGRTADGLPALPHEVQLCGKAEVADLDLHILVEHDVSQFQAE